MHLLAAQPGSIDDAAGAVDLQQTPGDIVMLSAADTELAAWAAARGRITTPYPSLRLANLMHLKHPLSVDIYVESIIARAKLVILRLLGGISYWQYAVEQITEACRTRNITLALLPGDDQPDPELAGFTTLGLDDCHSLWRYAAEGGPDNALQMLLFAGNLIGYEHAYRPPAPILTAGLYWPGLSNPSLADLKAAWQPGQPVAALVFYRAHWQAANLKPIDALIAALEAEGLNALPVYVSSLKQDKAAVILRGLLAETAPDIILNSTGFAVSKPGAPTSATPFDTVDAPILQVVLAGSTEAQWLENTAALPARDIAMQVALPEVDGRILTRAVSFKAEASFDVKTECSISHYQPRADRIAFVAQQAAGWVRLRQRDMAEKKIALILANYPNRDGRLGNGVGLDTPAATIQTVRALQSAGVIAKGMPESSAELMRVLSRAPTNAAGSVARAGGASLAIADYEQYFASLPEAVQQAVGERWGAPADDPYVKDACFRLGLHCFGHVVIGIQPARGYQIDPKSSYHDPDLVPPHSYFACYFWLRFVFRIDAVIHMGKHGNLEWLPGKSLCLSQTCYPEAVLGPVPHIYPFIVNDPGEGTQAKRRASAVIIDHLTPPLARAESYGAYAELERLIDEYYLAAGGDPRRVAVLRGEIIALSQSLGLDQDCGIKIDDDHDARLSKLDAYLCDLKELQIRDGLHIFGQSPEGNLRRDLLVALARIPRGQGQDGDASLQRALVKDLNFADFDPLDCDFARPWQGARPQILQELCDDPWRSHGDTVERLELLAQRLVDGQVQAAPEWTATQAVLETICRTLAPAIDACGPAEQYGLLGAVAGSFVVPGPSGAPTRGRPEVLPTGRNFYSVDTRTVPTPAAWSLAWRSAEMLLDDYRQRHGRWPAALALTAWGTANMRTGGDDIAQAMALMGTRPQWEPQSGRVTGFEIMPLALLDRPRVDVTLRISGFFRDAFPTQIALFDSAARAVAALQESVTDNPLAAQVRTEQQKLRRGGHSEEMALQQAGARVFGAMPGAYGAGLQALIDEGGWQDVGDLARAYIAWGGYAYSGEQQGQAAHGLFENRLRRVEAVVQNQDNREHDLLDSDDYYQFEGGLAAAVTALSGQAPVIYHNDHSRPESPKIRTLEQEIARIVRGRAANPKWLAGIRRHGYKGAFEMAASLDYLFAFAATTNAVRDHHFDALYDAYLRDEAMLDFLQQHNPAALAEMATRFEDAMRRQLWRPRSNRVGEHLSELQQQAAVRQKEWLDGR